MEKIISLFSQAGIISTVIAASGIWVWRALTVAFQLGELIKEIKSLRREFTNEFKRQGEDIKYIRDKLDAHLERSHGVGG